MSFQRHCWFKALVKMKRILYSGILLCLPLILSACSSFGDNTKTSIAKDIQNIKFSSRSSQQRVVIFSHGIHRPSVEICNDFNNKPPRSLMALVDNKTLVYHFCSSAIESPLSPGKQVYLRRIEIDHAIDAFLARGIQPKHLFLAGHSNGAWTSLMMMRDVNQRFNGVIAFAPGFSGKRSDVRIAPWWRNKVRPKQIKEMLKATSMDALVFSYENDAYNRPQDLQFLRKNYPLKTVNNKLTGVDLVSYDCGLKNAHLTYRNDCRLKETTSRIRLFVNDQINTW